MNRRRKGKGEERRTGSVARGQEHQGEPLGGRGDETGRLKKRVDSGLCCCSCATLPNSSPLVKVL